MSQLGSNLRLSQLHPLRLNQTNQSQGSELSSDTQTVQKEKWLSLKAVPFENWLSLKIWDDLKTSCIGLLIGYLIFPTKLLFYVKKAAENVKKFIFHAGMHMKFGGFYVLI